MSHHGGGFSGGHHGGFAGGHHGAPGGGHHGGGAGHHHHAGDGNGGQGALFVPVAGGRSSGDARALVIIAVIFAVTILAMFIANSG